jgi:hypothetical protein
MPCVYTVYTLYCTYFAPTTANSQHSVKQFTRKVRKSHAGEKKMYRQSIQEIWDRQMIALKANEADAREYRYCIHIIATIHHICTTVMMSHHSACVHRAC